MNIYLIKACFGDECITHLCLTYDEALVIKEKLFKEGADEILIEKWVYRDTTPNSLVHKEDIFFGYNPYTDEELALFKEEE